MATVAGIIDGTGSFGAAATQYFVSVLSNYGWDLVFVVLTVLLFASALLMVKLFFIEMKAIWRHGRRTSDEMESGFGIGQGYGDIEFSDSGDSNDFRKILRNCCSCSCCRGRWNRGSSRLVRVQRQSVSDFQG